MNEQTEEVTQEQRKKALSTVNTYHRNGVTTVYNDVAAYQLLDGILIIAAVDGTQYLLPMDTLTEVMIKQNQE